MLLPVHVRFIFNCSESKGQVLWETGSFEIVPINLIRSIINRSSKVSISLHFDGFSWKRFSWDQLLMQSNACWKLLFLDGGISSEMVLSSGDFHMSFKPPGALRALIIARKPHLIRFHFRVTGFTPRLWSLATSFQWSTKYKALRIPQSSSHSPHRRNCRWSLAISAKAVDYSGMKPYW